MYTTLARLERDGLVAPGGEDAAGHTLYAITDTGRAELREWYERPVDRAHPPRDELSIKLAMAVGSPGVDIRAVIQSQRHATIRAMQDYTRLKAQALTAVESGQSRERDDVAWLLVLEQLIFQTEAEARWLDHCEARLVRLSLPADRRAARPEPSQAAETEPDPETTAETEPETTADPAATATASTAPPTATRPRTARSRRG